MNGIHGIKVINNIYKATKQPFLCSYQHNKHTAIFELYTFSVSKFINTYEFLNIKFSSVCIYLYEGRSKSSRPNLILFRIKLKYYSSKAQNTTCTIWLLSYKYFVHFSVWTQCLSDGVENANTRTVHKFLKNFSNDTDVTQQKFISQLVIQDKMCIHNFNSESKQQSMQCNERIGQNCYFITLRNSIFSMSNANSRWPLKCTKYL